MNTFTLPTKIQKSRYLMFLFSLNIILLLSSINLVAQNNSGGTMNVPAISEGSVSGATQEEYVTPTPPTAVSEDAEINSSNTNTGNNYFLPPPANDMCSTALLSANTLTPGSNCKSGRLNLSTVEAGETFGCMIGPPTTSVWYSFVATSANMWLSTKQTSTPLVCGQNFGIRVYRYTGVCPPLSASEVGCKNYTPYSINQINNILNLTGLIVNNTYLVQIAQSPGCTQYQFCVRLGVPSTCTTCANVCGPMCVYSGPTPPTVPQVQATCPSYPLSPPMNQFDTQTNCYSFTAANDTVNLQQIIYSYCSPNTYAFTYNLYTSGCALIQSGNVFANNQIVGLTVGTTYRICYTLQAACSWDSIVWPYAYTTSSTLPVEFVSWGAMSFNEKVKLYWTTASEENCKEFIIERTLNAMDFTEVTRVKGAGNSTRLLSYKAYDDSPVEGNNFYRLKQVDFNGAISYTKLVAAKYSAAAGDVSIIPNPANEKASIIFNASGKYPVLLKVTDMKGNVITVKQFISDEGLNEHSLNMKEMTKGVYSVQLVVDDLNIVSKLVKD